MLALPWETRWPQSMDGDYNGLCSTSIHFPLLGCNLNPFSTTTLALSICQFHNFNHSTDYLVLQFIVYLFSTTRFGQFIWSIISMVLCIVCIVPTVFYSFYKSVYNFGPKHCKCSLKDILLNPVPGIEFEGRVRESSDYDSFKCRRFNHNPVGCRL